MVFRTIESGSLTIPVAPLPPLPIEVDEAIYASPVIWALMDNAGPAPSQSSDQLMDSYIDAAASNKIHPRVDVDRSRLKAVAEAASSNDVIILHGDHCAGKTSIVGSCVLYFF